MAIVRVQSTGKVRKTPADGSPVNLTFPGNVTAGNLIVVEIAEWKNNNNPVASISTDSLGNSYVNEASLRSITSSNSRALIIYAYNIAGGACTVPITVSGQYTTACATEFSGFTADDPLDVGATKVGNSTTPNVGPTAAAFDPDSLVCAVFGVSATMASITVDAVVPAFTQEFEELSFSFEPGEGVSRIVSAAGTESCSWTNGTSGNWAASIAVFSENPPLPQVNLTQIGMRALVVAANPQTNLTQISRRVLYSFTTCGAQPPVPTTTTYPIRRQRRFLLPSSKMNRSMSIPILELLMRTGVGLLPGPEADPPVVGANPQVMMRISKDGGETWGKERWRSAGLSGRHADRVRWLNPTGQYRDAVCEITVTDPVDWQFVAMLAPGGITEGSS